MADNTVVPLTKPKTYTHIMLDTETLGLTPSSLVLSLGAVVFCPVRGLGEEYYAEIDPETYLGTMDISTLQFWMKESASGMPCPINGIRHIESVLREFDLWLYQVAGDSELVIWANGTDFDIPKRRHAWDVHLGAVPKWKYSNVRDARTLYKLFGAYGGKTEENTEKHNALADAKWQALYLSSIIRGLQQEMIQLKEFRNE